MQKHVNLVDLVKSFPTNILLQNLASIQKRTSPIQFAHLAEKSEKGSISNLSTKASPAPSVAAAAERRRRGSRESAGLRRTIPRLRRTSSRPPSSSSQGYLIRFASDPIDRVLVRSEF